MSEGYVAGVQAGPAAVAFDTSHVALSRGNKLYRANGDRFHYDARDHVVAREGSWGRVTYVRDGLGRLRRIDWTSPDGSRTATTWEAEYDALGRRTKKVVHRVDASGAPVRDEWRFVWDRDRLAAEVLPDGRLRVYVYPDAVALVPMLALEYASTTSDPREGRVYSFHTDHRGAVERVEDAAGNVVWEAELGPYGEATVVVGPDFHQPFRLVGQYYDAETGLCAHRYRMYSPELGRFLESDPIGLQGGLNVYAWPGCPLVATDPLGLACPVERARGLAEGQSDAEQLPEGGISMAARRREVEADPRDRSEVPDLDDSYFFDTNISTYKRRDGEARPRREHGDSAALRRELRRGGAEHTETGGGYDAHHIIPASVDADHPLTTQARERGTRGSRRAEGDARPQTDGVDRENNGIMLPSSREFTPEDGNDLPIHTRPGHRDHPQYNKRVRAALDRRRDQLLEEHGVDSLDDVPDSALEPAVREVEDEVRRVIESEGSGQYLDDVTGIDDLFT